MGISYISEVLDIAVDFNIVNKSGAWFSFKGEKIGQGRENARIYLENNSKICSEIETLVKSQMKNKDVVIKNSAQENMQNEYIKEDEEDELLAQEMLKSEDFSENLDITPDENDF